MLALRQYSIELTLRVQTTLRSCASRKEKGVYKRHAADAVYDATAQEGHED
jgi:hypothetical protein